MEKSRSIAILLAAYNGSEFLGQQIGSINIQTDVDMHIYISVDVSSDETYEFCKRLEKQYDNITVLEYGERFGGAAKNFYRLIHDVDFTHYDYVALADQDDIWLEGKLSRAVSCIENEHVDAYSSNVIAFWQGGRKKIIKKSYPQVKYDYFFEAAGPGCSYVFKTATLLRFKDFMGQHKERIKKISLHDWMLYAFCRHEGMTWYIDDQASLLYRQHASNQVGSNIGIKAFIKRISMVKKKWYRKEVEKIISVLAFNQNTFSLERAFLLKNFYQLRRRPRDKYILALFILMGLF